jgi:phosphotransferase system HPr (HPr) family protein
VSTDASAPADDVRETELVVEHPAGLHMRPAALFVRTASRFASQVRARNLSRGNGPEVDAKSIIGVMQVAVSQGDRLLVRAQGPDAPEAIAALTALVTHNFNE